LKILLFYYLNLMEKIFGNRLFNKNKYMNKNNNQWLLVGLIYIISNFFMLVNQGVFWDDWLIFNTSYINISTFFERNGIKFPIYSHFFLQNLTNSPVLLYNSITFIVGLFSVFIFSKILKAFKLEKTYIYILVLIIAVIPYNQAKHTMICIFYSVGIFLLLNGILFFIISIRKGSILLRILIFPIIILSFNFLPSSLVFWLSFIMLYSIYLQPNLEFSFSFFKKVVQQLYSWLDFILLPFIYWIIRSIFFQPIGVLAEQQYNEPNIGAILLSPLKLISVFLTNIFGLFSEAFAPIAESVVIGIAFVIFFGLLYMFFNKQKQFLALIHDRKYFLIIGIYLFVAGAFPYVAVGKPPSFSGFGDRLQILLPFGTSFIILYMLSLVKSFRLQKITFAVIISAFVIANINAQIKYTKSWFKQESLLMHFKEEPLLTPHKNFVLIDRTTDYNENERGIAFWALSGMLRSVFKDESRFAIEVNDFKYYNGSISQFQYYYLVEKGSFVLKSSTCMMLLYQYYFQSESYRKNVKNVLACKILPYNYEINNSKNLIND
jgi:hypothetical protein